MRVKEKFTEAQRRFGLLSFYDNSITTARGVGL